MNDEYLPWYDDRSMQELTRRMPPGGRLLGIDFGDARIGIASSDPALRVATAVETLKRETFAKDAKRLAEIIDERRVFGLVVGWPLSLNGEENARTQATRAFIRNLHKRGEIELPHCLWDERLTSSQVEKFLIEGADMTRAKRKKVVDQMAAVVILQSALDSLEMALSD